MNALLGLLEGEGRMEQMLDMLLETLEDYIPTLAGIAVMVVLLAFSQRLLLSGLKSKGAEARLPRQLMMLALTLCGLFVILLLLPMEATTRGDVIRLIGVLFTAVIALSSATFVSNAMAGMMVRKIKCFRLGDFRSCQRGVWSYHGAWLVPHRATNGGRATSRHFQTCT